MQKKENENTVERVRAKEKETRKKKGDVKGKKHLLYRMLAMIASG